MSASSSSAPAATRKRKSSSGSHKSLASLLRHFEGYELTVEVKNGRLYRGNVDSTDEFMNVMLSGVVGDNAKKKTKSPQNSTQQVVAGKQLLNEPLRSGSVSSSMSSSHPQSRFHPHPSADGHDKNTTNDKNNTTEQQQQQPTLNLDIIHIRGANIRYIHFPSDVDLLGTIKIGLDRERSAANKYRRGIRK